MSPVVGGSSKRVPLQSVDFCRMSVLADREAEAQTKKEKLLLKNDSKLKTLLLRNHEKKSLKFVILDIPSINNGWSGNETEQERSL